MNQSMRYDFVIYVQQCIDSNLREKLLDMQQRYFMNIKKTWTRCIRLQDDYLV